MATDNRKLGYRIFLGVVVALLGGSMLLYLVPQTPGTGEAATDAVAKVGDQTVTLGEVRQQLAQIEQRNQVPKPLESLYARQILLESSAVARRTRTKWTWCARSSAPRRS